MLPGIEGHRVQNSLIVILREDTGGDVIRGVCFEDAWPVVIVVLKDGRGDEGCFKTLES